MDSTKWISKKIALLGFHAVGKTSLISQFVYQKFPESYLTTIGLKVDKKTVEKDGYRLDLVIWDIAGQEQASQIPHYYLKGCSGIIYVVDLSRPSTYEDIESQLSQLQGYVEETEILLIGNKSDLLEADELENVVASMKVRPALTTSAKLGLNVEEMFLEMASRLISRHES